MADPDDGNFDAILEHFLDSDSEEEDFMGYNAEERHREEGEGSSESEDEYDDEENNEGARVPSGYDHEWLGDFNEIFFIPCLFFF